MFNTTYISIFNAVGREYRAIFVSTTEATDRNGFCKNPTKSMTDPFVFNTVITRAKSLVVCIGNPYFLCHLEEKMKPGNKCWSTYINHCLDCETFVCLNSNFGQIEKDKLQSILPTSSGRHLINQELSAGDKIIQGYLDSLAQFEEQKKILKFSQNWGDYQWTSYDCDDECYDNEYYYEEDDNDSIPDSQSTCYVTEKCVVDILSRHQALARSVENPNHIIHIRGHKNLRGVFHESTVLVEYSNQQKNEKMVYNGKVVKLLELSSTTFFCEVDHHDSLKFHPINKKDPVFINLPVLSKNEDGVPLFDLQSEGDVPRVVQVFPQQIARKRIFVLKYLYWDHKKYSSPLGIVIDSLSKGYTYSAGEKLLCSQYKFDFFDINCSLKPLKPIELHQSDKVFTIIEKSNEIIENAFSVQVRDQDTYLINYYVINVASYIEDEMLTDLLKNSGVSAFVKTDKLNAWKLHSMFPPELLRNLNFVLSEPRSCFKLSCLAKIKTAQIEPGKIVETSIEEIIAVPTRTYTLHQVENQLEIQQEFRVLFNIAQCLQLEKLGYSEAGYNCIFDSLETPCAQLILKEFSSWANRLVAMKLVNSSFISFPLHCELPPNAEEKQSVYKDHGDALQTSLHNKYFLPKNGYKILQDVKINSNALPVLLEALKNEDLFMYLAMLVYDNIFPQLHVASHKFRSIKKTKKIVQCTEASAIDFSVSHNRAFYTALFTSPLTSSFDILTQGFLSAALNHQPLKYDKEELEPICQKATKDFLRRSDFEDKMFNLQLGVTLKAFSHKVVGYVEKVDSKSWLRLSFPSHELKNLDENELSFNIAHLLAFEGFGSNSLATLYEWNVKIASFEGPSSIFTSPDIFLNRMENADATIDITLFMASSEKEKSHFYAELDKERISGSVKSSTITVNLDEWKKLTKVMYNPTGNCCQDAIKILSSHYKNYSMKRKDLESTKQISEQTVCWSGTVRRKLQKKYDTLHVWLGAAQDATIVYPKIQQVEIAPFLKICVQHNSEPEKCFANASFINASQKCYMHINEYIKLWGQVLMAENAAYSVRTRDIFC